MEPTCTHYECKAEPVARVSGGAPMRDRGKPGTLTWMGLYCAEHVLSCVEVQLFQVSQGMPIVIEELKS